MRIIGRVKAADSGLSFFYTGKPCKAGHIAERHVVSGSCVECNKLHSSNTQRKTRARLRNAITRNGRSKGGKP